MKKNYPCCYDFSPEEVAEKSKIPLLVAENCGEIFYAFALNMIEQIEENNRLGRRSVFICPAGPVGQYPIFARLAKTRKLCLQNTWIINMDEYLDETGHSLAPSDPLSFHYCMDQYLYNRLDPEFTVPVNQRVFPDPAEPEAIGDLIKKLGGVDIAFGGVALNGHLAFNDPLPELSIEEFAALSTRVVKLSQTTRIKDAILNRGGAVDSLPEQAITIGMKEIFSARKVRFSMMLDMQRAVLRKACCGEISSSCPISFAQRHPDAILMVTSNVMNKPF